MKTKTIQKRRGRPTLDQAEKLQSHLLDVALSIFTEQGFDGTTMDTIAAAAATSKRTLYSRYPDKSALFRSAIERAIEHTTIPLERIEAAITEQASTTLFNIATLRLDNIASPEGVRLNRLLTSEAYRFPELVNYAFKTSTGPTITFLSRYFSQLDAQGVLTITDPDRTAIAFLTLALGGPARLITTGQPLDNDELVASLHFSINLFLHGALAR